MGYAFLTGPCFGCKRVFSYNPNHVHSIRIEGFREPVCEACINRANPERIKNGLPPIVPHKDAYEPCDENELSYD